MTRNDKPPPDDEDTKPMGLVLHRNSASVTMWYGPMQLLDQERFASSDCIPMVTVPAQLLDAATDGDRVLSSLIKHAKGFVHDVLTDKFGEDNVTGFDELNMDSNGEDWPKTH